VISDIRVVVCCVVSSRRNNEVYQQTRRMNALLDNRSPRRLLSFKGSLLCHTSSLSHLFPITPITPLLHHTSSLSFFFSTACSLSLLVSTTFLLDTTIQLDQADKQTSLKHNKFRSMYALRTCHNWF